VSAMEFDAPLPSAADEMPPGGMVSASRQSVIRPESGGLAHMPAIVETAGEQAVRAYEEFFDDARWSPYTRKLYGQRVRRFFRWAEASGLTLETIDRAALAAYITEFLVRKSTHDVITELTPVRAVLGHLARSGLLAADSGFEGEPTGHRFHYKALQNIAFELLRLERLREASEARLASLLAARASYLAFLQLN
jgi:hypothetical protein